MEEFNCPLCQADFPISVRVNGKCKQCDKEHPNVASLEEFKEQENKDEKRRTLSESVVRSIIYEVLEDEVGLKRIACEKCQVKFFPKSPAQKYCKDCAGKKDKGPKTNDEIAEETK